MKTAREFILGEYKEEVESSEGLQHSNLDIEYLMTEFAKYHVEKALEVASEKGCDSLELYNSEYGTLKKSVKEAYPLNNIK